MTQENLLEIASNSPGENGRQTTKWWQWIVMYPTLFISVLGAIPTYTGLVDSARRGVEPKQLDQAKEQAHLWAKNIACIDSNNYIDLPTEQGTKVTALICPSGDMLLTKFVPAAASSSVIKTPDSLEPVSRWVGNDAFQEESSFTNFLIQKAIAAPPKSEELLAQAVICSKSLEEGRLLRRVEYNGQCFDEIVNTYTGEVISRTPASSCSSGCG